MKNEYRYKTAFESVSAIGPGRRFYNGDRPNVHPSLVPDEFWSETVVEHDGEAPRMDQYRTLRGWAATGEELIRNVRLYQTEVQEPDWAEVIPDDH